MNEASRSISSGKGDLIFIGCLGMIPDGLVCFLSLLSFILIAHYFLLQDESGDLVRTTVPNLSQQSRLESQGLLNDGGHDKSLSISASWTAAEVEEWLREKLPKPFQWLDDNTSPSDLRYRLLIKAASKFSLCTSTAPTGYDLSKYKGGSGKSWVARQVWIGMVSII